MCRRCIDFDVVLESEREEYERAAASLDARLAALDAEAAEKRQQ